LRVALFINGTLGDKSFFDAAARGIREAAATLPVSIVIVEGGTDPTRWQAALADLADSGEHDLIITGTFTMVPYVEQLSPRYPDTRFVVYDAAVDRSRCACANVQSIVFRQNEAAYLAGYLAARLDAIGLPGVPAGGGLGVIGGMQFPVVEDFIVGFRAGAAAAAPGLPVSTQYANSFSDPAIGKEIAKAQFGRGAGLVFHVAGATGQGANEAALEAQRYAIGVDTDQAALVRAANPALAARIVTSVLKHVDVAVLRAVERNLNPMPNEPLLRSLGLADNGVGLAEPSDVLTRMPPALREEMARVRAEIVQGARAVPSAFARQAVQGGGS
jgi:basic membrane protein A